MAAGGCPTKTLKLQPWSDALASELATFPDYLIHRLATAGIGRVEAEPGRDDCEAVWRYTSRRSGQQLEFARLPIGRFRPLLARWAAFSGTDPFSGHALFAVDAQPGWPSTGTHHRFSCFVCNEPAMAFWFRLYLYCSDGEWPMPNAFGPERPISTEN